MPVSIMFHEFCVLACMWCVCVRTNCLYFNAGQQIVVNNCYVQVSHWISVAIHVVLPHRTFLTKYPFVFYPDI